VPGVLFYQGYTPVPGHSCIASNFSFLGALHCGYQFLVGDDLDTLRNAPGGLGGALARTVAVVDLASNALLLVPLVGAGARGAIKVTAAGILRTVLRRAVSEGELRTLDELGGHAGAQLGEGEYQQLDQGARQGEGQKRPVDTGGGCGCFVAGTQVATPGGSVAIERLRKGMRVLAENPATGKVEAEPVVRLITDQVSPLLAVELSDGTTLKVTADHPFWVDSGDHLAHSGWLHAEHLRPGDRLRTATGTDVVVIRVRRNVGHAVVYTLTVARDHTFFVGPANVLVHNALPINCPRVTVSGNEVTVLDPQTGQPLGVGELDNNGNLSLAIAVSSYPKGQGVGSGVFDRIYYYFVNVRGTVPSGIQAKWVRSLPDNLDTFNRLLLEGKTETEAARGTFTGRQATKVGLTGRTKILKKVGTYGHYTNVEVLFDNR